jgi:hypothetical protein
LVSYEREKDIDNKIKKFLKVTGIINNTFKTNKKCGVKNFTIFITGTRWGNTIALE